MPRHVTLAMVQKMCELPKSLGKMKQNQNEYMMLHRMKLLEIVRKDDLNVWNVTTTGDAILKDLEDRLARRVK